MNAPTNPSLALPAILFRERMLDDAGEPCDDNDPDSWEVADDGRDPTLLELGHGKLLITGVNDCDAALQEALTDYGQDDEVVRATFTGDATCPTPRMEDILTVRMDGRAISYTVILAHEEMPQHLTTPGELCLALLPGLSVV